MKQSTRIALGYLAIAITWISASDFLFARLFPESYIVISIYKGWIFVVMTALLLKIWLAGEENRRDALRQRAQSDPSTDPLTGLHSRAALLDGIGRAIARDPSERKGFGIVYLDIDGFKAFNRTHGFATGDGLLREFGARLRALLGPGEFAGRFDGDAFVVVANDAGGLAALADRLTAALGKPYRIKGRELQVAVSAGIARYPEQGPNVDALLASADDAAAEAARAKADAPA